MLNNNFDHTQPNGFYADIPLNVDPSNLNKVDPHFVDPVNDDLHLHSESPMIDAGYPSTTDLPEFDIEGNPRVLGESVDIGAYEYDDGTRYNLTTNLKGYGLGRVTSNPTGINCGNDCTQAFPHGTNVTLTATPDPAYVFNRWTGACTGTNPVCTVKMDAAKTATAEFVINYPLIRGWSYNP